MGLIKAHRNKTDVPVFMLVTRDGGIIGLTVTIKILSGADATFFLDFDDGVFKQAGHTTPTLTLTEPNDVQFPGLYEVSGGFDLTAITLPAAVTSLVVFYNIAGGGETGNDIDTIQFNDESVHVEVGAAYDKTAGLERFRVKTVLHRGGQSVVTGLTAATVSIRNRVGLVIASGALGAVAQADGSFGFELIPSTLPLPDEAFSAEATITDVVGTFRSNQTPVSGPSS